MNDCSTTSDTIISVAAMLAMAAIFITVLVTTRRRP